MMRIAQSLRKVVNESIRLKQVRKSGLKYGDWLLIATQNLIYSIRVLRHGLFRVSGGWFDRKGLSPMKTTIAGCTWGGRIIKIDIVAACGLCLEFGNHVVTSPIKEILIVSRRVEETSTFSIE